MIYVDGLKRYRKQQYCHCVSDVSITDLHHQMQQCGVGRQWVHKDHYDLNPLNRAKVLPIARQVDAREIVRIRRKVAGNGPA